MGREKFAGPPFSARRQGNRQRRERAWATPAQCINIDQIKLIEGPLVVHVGQIGHPGVVNGYVPILRGSNAAYFSGADIGSEKAASPVEGQVDGAVVLRVHQRRGPSGHVLEKRHDVLGLCAALVDESVKIICYDM